MLGEDGRVVGLRTERMELTGDGNVRGTGEFHDWDVQAVYRAVGYRSEPIDDLPFDDARLVLPNVAGRVLDLDGEPVPGIYATGWVKRGPVGLIGHTKSDAAETVANLLADAPALRAGAAARPDRGVIALLLRQGSADHRLRRLGPTGRARAFTRRRRHPSRRRAGTGAGQADLPGRDDRGRTPPGLTGHRTGQAEPLR